MATEINLSLDLSNPWMVGGLLIGAGALTYLLVSNTRTYVDPKLLLDLQGGKSTSTALQMHYSVPRENREVPDYPDRKMNHDTSQHPSVSTTKIDPRIHLLKQGHNYPVYGNHKIDPVHLGMLRASQDATPVSGSD